MALIPQILFGKVMHGRLFPKRNSFNYGIYYLCLPLSQIKNLPIAQKSFAPISFKTADHGNCDGSDLEQWARNILAQYNIQSANGEITLICMPRIFGYVFNPVSFWLCHDTQKNLRAVLCEVHNTFKERHAYLCAHEDHRPISQNDTLTAKKIFHVSPFLEREGHYEFRFSAENEKFCVWIDYFDYENNKQLVTSLIGERLPMNKKNIRKAIWGYPLITFKAITLIHWHALKIISKGIKYIARPPQKQERISATDNLTKM